MKVLENAIKDAKGNARVIGKLLREIGAASPQAAELIEQDLAGKAMSLDGCWKALQDYARKHQSGGCWGRGVFGIDPENEVVKVVLDYFKIPPEWLGGGTVETGTDAPGVVETSTAETSERTRASASGGVIDLMSLL